MLDTNIAIHLSDGDEEITAKVERLQTDVLLSVISRVELEGGVHAVRADAALRRMRLERLLESISVVPFDDVAANAYRNIVEAVGYSRRKVIDRMIAAHALVHRATLVTCNGDDFRDVPGLELLEW